MRLEIIIPDSTRPDLKAMLTSLTQRLSARPELVEEIHLNGDDEDAAIQRMFTPERLAIIDAADADISAGNGLTMEQLDARLAATRTEWLAANPS
ncbi:MAG: hypothetical protein P4L46_16125 [Fimbriimonas sp.]|nr:hypothetical protein [Fimbriimonas sp.]